MEQQIHFCTTSDGVSIAYATVGSGPPLVYVCGWPGHLAMEWEHPFVREFLEAFAHQFTLIRYDMRGSGLSTHVAADAMTIDALTRDLEAVVDDAGSGQVPLLSLGLLAGPVAVQYAVAHPDRVSRLVLLSAFLRGEQLATEEQKQALIGFVSAFGQMAVTDPGGQGLDPVLVHEAAAIHRSSAPTAIHVALLKLLFTVDISEPVPRLEIPVLVLHGSRDDVARPSMGREVAARIRNVEFVPYTGAGSAPWADSDILLTEVFRFLGADALARRPETAAAHDSHAAAVHTVLFTDIEDSTGLTQRLGDAQAQDLVRAHDIIVREALRQNGGTEIKHTGDGIMASFHSASRAIDCAVAIQRAVDERDDEHLHVHIGLNAGEPVAEGQDLFGTAVQLARRICDHSAGSEVLVSDVVRQLAAGKGFLFNDRGEVALRGFEDPVRLYAVRWNERSS